MVDTLWPLLRKPSTKEAVLFATDACSSDTTMGRFLAVVDIRSVTRTMGSLTLALGVTTDASAQAGARLEAAVRGCAFARWTRMAMIIKGTVWNPVDEASPVHGPA